MMNYLMTMTWRDSVIRYMHRGMHWSESLHVYRKCKKMFCLNHTVQLYILVPCGANIDVNNYENCVLPRGAYTIFFRKLTHQAMDCSASHVFVSRKLTTCKMLVRRNVYGFMLNVQKSNNLILNSIVHTRSSRKPHSNSTLWCTCIVTFFLVIWM